MCCIKVSTHPSAVAAARGDVGGSVMTGIIDATVVTSPAVMLCSCRSSSSQPGVIGTCWRALVEGGVGARDVAPADGVMSTCDEHELAE